MKVGTLIEDKSTRRGQPERYGVVVENNGKEIIVYWSKGEPREAISIRDLNKWMSVGYFRIVERGEKIT